MLYSTIGKSTILANPGVVLSKMCLLTTFSCLLILLFFMPRGKFCTLITFLPASAVLGIQLVDVFYVATVDQNIGVPFFNRQLYVIVVVKVMHFEQNRKSLLRIFREKSSLTFKPCMMKRVS